MAGGNQQTGHREESDDSTEQTREDASAGETGPAGLDCVDESVEESHLEDLPDGSGCVEVWEYLADRRGDPE